MSAHEQRIAALRDCVRGPVVIAPEQALLAGLRGAAEHVDDAELGAWTRTAFTVLREAQRQPSPSLDVVPGWRVPAWATRTEGEVDAIAHVADVGEVELLPEQPGDQRRAAVTVLQLDTVTAREGGRYEVEHTAPEVNVGGLRLSAVAARRLASHLVAAAQLVEGATGPGRSS